MYAKFFRICPETIIGGAPLKKQVISFILFDLHTKKPAPDAIGVFSTCRR